MTTVDRLLLYVPGLVGVYRKCRTCGEWKKLGNFNHGSARVCHRCRMPMQTPSRTSAVRNVVVTELGHAEVRAIRAREQSA